MTRRAPRQAELPCDAAVQRQHPKIGGSDGVLHDPFGSAGESSGDGVPLRVRGEFPAQAGEDD